MNVQKKTATALLQVFGGDQSIVDDLLGNGTNTASEVKFLNGVVAGTTTASKGLVVDSSKALDVLTITTATLPTIAGTTAHTGRITTTDGVPTGTAKVVGGLAYSNAVVSTTVTATSAETLFDASYTIPANTLKVGSVVDIEYKARVIAQNSTDTFAFKLYIGGLSGTALISHAATSAAAATIVNGRIRLTVRTIGAGGTFVGTGSYKSVPAAAGTATYKDADVESTAIDTTATQVIGVSVTHSSNNAGNQSALDVLNVIIW